MAITRRPSLLAWLLTFWCHVHVNWSNVVVVVAFSSSARSTSVHQHEHPLLQDKLRYAMQLSSASARNITAAFEACQEWEDIFDGKHMKLSTLSGGDTIVAIARALQASCLVRVGQDERALLSYDEALKFDTYLDEKTRNDLLVGKATALQRLLRYQDALDQFRKSTTDRGVYGGATCALRLGQMEDAIDILKNHLESEINPSFPDSRSMLLTLRILSGKSDEERQNDCLSLLEESSSKESLLYSWICRVLCSEKASLSTSNKASLKPKFLDLIQINQSPFDDPGLLRLDDKVLLHKLMDKYGEKSNKFWPKGMILSNQHQQENVDMLKAYPASKKWIRKTRSGYGSHGNTLLTTDEALQVTHSREMQAGEETLLQSVVDPPMLIHGKKFSVRIYVVYFSPGSRIYISNEGLVKLAAKELSDEMEISKDRMYMTNSGREATMDQYDLKFLSQIFAQRDLDYSLFWSRIESAVAAVLNCYLSDRNDEAVNRNPDSITYLQRLRIPKILGLDFLLDSSANPWLLEVNRFPGLEPRDASDQRVKYKVVSDAWRLASELAGLEDMTQFLTEMDPISIQSPSSLFELPLTEIRK